MILSALATDAIMLHWLLMPISLLLLVKHSTSHGWVPTLYPQILQLAASTSYTAVACAIVADPYEQKPDRKCACLQVGEGGLQLSGENQQNPTILPTLDHPVALYAHMQASSEAVVEQSNQSDAKCEQHTLSAMHLWP